MSNENGIASSVAMISPLPKTSVSSSTSLETIKTEMKSSIARLSLISLLTIYLASAAFPVFLHFSSLEYSASTSIAVNLALGFGSFIGLLIWCAIYSRRYPDSVCSVLWLLIISFGILLFISFTIPAVTALEGSKPNRVVGLILGTPGVSMNTNFTFHRSGTGGSAKA